MCLFPPNNPIQDLESNMSVGVRELEQYRLHVYNNSFGMRCGGCVRAVTFCYRNHSCNNEFLFTIEIRGSSNFLPVPCSTTTNDNWTNTSMKFSRILSHTDRCIELTLDHPFPVNHNEHYALRVPGLSNINLLRHNNKTTNGSQYDIQHDMEKLITTMHAMIYQPLFQFSINTSDRKLHFVIIIIIT